VKRHDPGLLAVCVLPVLAACVPAGSAPPSDAGPPPSAAPTVRPSIGVMTAPFEDTFDRPDVAEPAELLEERDGALALVLDGARGDAPTASDAPLPSLLGEAGQRAARGEDSLGPSWRQIRTRAWRIEDGRLCGEKARNHPVWLTKVLPVNARIEFDAVSYSDDGDLKAEVWGDGRSAATGVSYNNASSYLTIFGGWKNTLHVIARLDEHGKDRKVVQVDKDSDDPRERPVVREQVYRFVIERTDGKTVRWSVDGTDMLSYADPKPLTGDGHDHFGFNNWEAKVCFDNVRVTPL
jgi:hypothetical protein